jgi:DNA primase catalytic subunit
MNERTKNFLREKFKEYYLKYPIQLPPGFESREWGFVMFVLRASRGWHDGR